MQPELVGLKPVDLSVPLAQISTIWTVVSSAYGGPDSAAGESQKRFMERYHGAVYRYFFTSLRDAEAAQELFQEFAERFLRGDFKRFDPAKGRFRDYLKVALINMIRDHRKRLALRGQLHLGEITDPGTIAEDNSDVREDAFLATWREDLLARTWEALKNQKRRGGLPFHVVLEKSVENPDLTSADLAVLLQEGLPPSKSLSAASVRKTLQLARERFADLLVDEVARSLGDHTVEQLEQELIDLRLIRYCRDALHLRWIVDS